MATVTFRWSDAGPDKGRALTVETPPGTTPTLLELAGAHGVPLLFSCRTGDCGACRVEVSYPCGRPETLSPLTTPERLHQEASRLAGSCARDLEADGLVDHPDVRLACQYRLRGETIMVAFPTIADSF